jgi:hypothetical protein
MLKNDINVGLLVTVGSISAMLLLVVLLGVHAWYLYEVDLETQAKWNDPAKVVNQEVHDLKLAQASDLKVSNRWSDREKGTVRMSIDDAMEVIAKGGGKSPAVQGAAPAGK